MADVNQANNWDAYYEGGRDAWDLRGATPAFNRLANGGRFKPGKMIVPGAGRGHDARLFARHGFQVTAVDFSAFAAREMQRLAEADAPVEIVQSDLFLLPQEFNRTFDYVLEYTCFCAIDPQRRGEYADLVARLLKPAGIYIDLAFPLDARKGGPPFAVSIPEVTSLFGERGFKLLERETPSDSAARRQKIEQLLIFQGP